MPRSRSYEEELGKALQDPQAAAEYLNAALEDEDPRVFLLALRDVAEAQGGLRQLSAATGLNRETMYRTLSTKGNPRLRSLDTLLHAMGFKLAVEVEHDARAAAGQ